jgi:hypothetical protein
MPATFLLLLLVVGLASLAPLFALAGAALCISKRFRELGAYGLALGLVCGTKLSLGWLFLGSFSAGTSAIDLTTLVAYFGAGFSVGFMLVLLWHIAQRPRPNNSFKPSPLRGVGKGR